MYRKDLAHIHDQGYSLGVAQATSFIVSLLRSSGVRRGHILDAGCGSGHSTAVFAKAGYDVVGMDCSPAMIHLARRRMPRSTFVIGRSLSASVTTPWDVIVAVGEVFNYLPSRQLLQDMILRTFETLRPGGYLAFDIRTPPPPSGPQGWLNGKTEKDWAVITTCCVQLRRPKQAATDSHDYYLPQSPWQMAPWERNPPATVVSPCRHSPLATI